jgi:hypothetical protein
VRAGLQVGQRAVEQGAGAGQQRLGVGAGLAQHAREAQQVHQVDLDGRSTGARHLGEAGEHGLQPVDDVGIQFQRSLAAGVATICEGAVHLAPAQFLLQAGAQLGIERPQFIREAQGSFEEAVVHAAQLADQRAAGDAGLRARKAGHARDHSAVPAQCLGAMQ